MSSRLPDEATRIRNRLIDAWIPPGRPVRAQVAGLATVTGATWSVLAKMLGLTTTRTIFARAALEASKREPRLAGVKVVDGGYIVEGLEAAFDGLDSDSARAGIVEIIDHLVSLMRGLFGAVVVAILRDVETDLVSTKPNPLRVEQPEDRT